MRLATADGRRPSADEDRRSDRFEHADAGRGTAAGGCLRDDRAMKLLPEYE